MADQPADAEVSAPVVLGRGFRSMERFQVALRDPDIGRVEFERDLVRGGHAIGVLAVDPLRREVVLLSQFRLSAHLAYGKGNMIELVAGRVEAGETPEQAAHRECIEEVGLTPLRLVELFDYLTTPGLSDERITLYLAVVDAVNVPEMTNAEGESENIRPIRVRIDDAVAALQHTGIHTALTLLALQWLALNRGRLNQIAEAAPR